MARARHRGSMFGIALLGACIGLVAVASASLDAALSFSSPTVNVGSGVVVTLTVTNTGGADATNMFPQIFVAGPAVVTAPTPLTVAALTAGSLTTFQWTLSPTAGGSIAVTANATADGPDVSPTAAGSVSVPAPALDALLNAQKTTVTVGQGVQLILTVTNTGGSAAANVKATAWSSTVTGTGPAPATLATLAAGAKAMFTWTATPTAALAGQTIFFTASAVGDGLAPTAWASATVIVQSAPAVTARLTATSATVTGGPIVLVLTVSNSGQASANVSMTTTAFKTSGSGATATAFVGPTPAQPILVASGATVTLTWTVTAVTAGTGLTISNTVYVVDANGGPALANLWVKSGNVVVGKFGSLADQLSVIRTATALGQPVQFVLSVTNTGGVTVTNLTAQLWTDPGVATYDAVSTPAAVATLAPGALTTFTWTAVPLDSRAITFNATVGGFTTSITGQVAVAGTQVSLQLPGIPLPALTTSFIFPSPARDSASIAYTMAEAGKVRIRVYNEAGQLVATVEDTRPAGVQSSALTTSSLAPGVYYYRLVRTYDSGTAETKVGVRKFLVVR